MKTKSRNGTSTMRLLLIVSLTVIVLNFISGNRMTKFVTDYFTIEWEGETQEAKNAETLHEERIRELEERIDEYERTRREQELEDKIAELEKKLERSKRHQDRKKHKDQKGEPELEVNLDGIWKNKVNNSTYKIHQFNNKVSFQEVETLYGIETVTAAGEGQIDDGQLNIDFNTIYTTNGKAQLDIQLEGNELVGYSKDLVTGSEIILKLMKIEAKP